MTGWQAGVRLGMLECQGQARVLCLEDPGGPWEGSDREAVT